MASTCTLKHFANSEQMRTLVQVVSQFEIFKRFVTVMILIMHFLVVLTRNPSMDILDAIYFNFLNNIFSVFANFEIKHQKSSIA